MKFIRRHIKYILFLAVASLMITQQAYVGHFHVENVDHCVICKITDHSSGLTSSVEPLAIVFIIFSLVSIEYRNILFFRKSCVSPFLRAPPSFLK